MTQFIQYYKDNAKLFNVTLIVLGVCLVAIILIAMLRKYVHKKRELKKEVEKATEALSAMPHTEVENDLFLDPQLNEETKQENEEADKLAQSQTESSDNDVSKTDGNTAVDNTKNAQAEETKADKETKTDTKAVTENDESKNSARNENVDSKNGETVTSRIVTAETDKEQKNQSVKETAPETKDSKQKFYPKRNPDTKKEAKPATKYSGKWLIYKDNGKYAANLVASNGEVLLRTEPYTALSGIKSGIETIKNNIAKDNFAISVDKNGNYFFKLYSSSTRLLCVSEGYSNKSVLESAIESVKRFSKTAVIEIKKEDAEG